MRREQRFVFGEVAELYDRHRPAYPDAVVDDLIDPAGLAAGALVLEVGAGTGKATAMFAARGIRVLTMMWAGVALRATVLDAYCQAAPEVLDETDPIHPESSLPRDEDDWRRGVAATSGLGAVEVRDYEWSQTYSAGAYAALLETHSTVRVLEAERRSALVGAVARAIEKATVACSRCRC